MMFLFTANDTVSCGSEEDVSFACKKAEVHVATKTNEIGIVDDKGSVAACPPCMPTIHTHYVCPPCMHDYHACFCLQPTTQSVAEAKKTSDLKSKAVTRVTVRAQMKRKNPKTDMHDIKSAWSATALLTVGSVYHAVTTPACESYEIKDESVMSKIASPDTSGTFFVRACVSVRVLLTSILLFVLGPCPIM